MKSIIIRALNRVCDMDGESVLEFLLALATKKLQLMPDHFDEVKKCINHLAPTNGGAATSIPSYIFAAESLPDTTPI
jgi:hypothetical protein